MTVKKKPIKRTKRCNPKNKLQDCYDFQSFRFWLANVYGHDDADFIGGRKSYDKIESLVMALKLIAEPSGKLLDYQKELLTPRISKSIDELAELLRKQVIATAFKNGIDSFTGLPIEK